MKLGTEREYALIPAGEHLLKLTACDKVELDDHFGRSDTGKVVRIKWRFVSQAASDDGVPYDYITYTGLEYGNEKAGLTKLLDMLVPGITKKVFDEFDTDDLIGRKFRARIKHVKREDGTPRPELVLLEPVVPRPAKSAPVRPVQTREDDPDDDTLSDPFEDDPV